jgi:hypothetical protein
MPTASHHPFEHRNRDRIRLNQHAHQRIFKHPIHYPSRDRASWLNFAPLWRGLALGRRRRANRGESRIATKLLPSPISSVAYSGFPTPQPHCCHKSTHIAIHRDNYT